MVDANDEFRPDDVSYCSIKQLLRKPKFHKPLRTNSFNEHDRAIQILGSLF